MVSTTQKPFIWPDRNTFKYFMFTDQVKVKIEAIIHNVFPQYLGAQSSLYPQALEIDYPINLKKYLKFVDGNECYIFVDELPKGSDVKKIVKGYSPLSGRFIVFKEFCPRDLPMITWVYSHLGRLPNCVQSVGRIDSVVLEPYYETTLDSELQERRFNTTVKKIKAITDLVNGLAGIHSLSYINQQYKTSDGLVLSGIFTHRDLKPDNIFGKLDSNNQLTLYVGDFGRVGLIKEQSTYGRLSPEAIEFYKLNLPLRDIALFHHFNGSRMDVWQLGILVSSILKNKYIPFDWFEKNWGEDQIKNLINIEREEVEKEIDQALKAILPEDLVMKKCWKMVKKYLLQVDPNLRRDMTYIQKKVVKINHLLAQQGTKG